MSDYSEVGTPVVMPTNIRDLRIDATDIARVSSDHVDRLARHKLRVGDIVYSRRGDVEKCALITDREAGWLCGTGCLLVRVAGPTVDARFLSYSLSSPQTRAWISQHAVGATMPNLNTGILREVPVDLPPISEQRAVAATLGAIDDKIESNRRVADLASWLADSLAEALLSANSTQTVPISNVVRFNQSQVKPGSTPALDYIDIASVSPGRIEAIQRMDWADAPSRARRSVEDGDVIFSTVRPGRRAFALVLDPSRLAVASTGFAVMTPTRGIGSSLLTTIASSRAFADYLESVAQGSAYPAVSVEAMERFNIALPVDTELIARFEEQAMPLRRRAARARVESTRLVAIRDALLPELLSGRMRASGAPEVVA